MVYTVIDYDLGIVVYRSDNKQDAYAFQRMERILSGHDIRVMEENKSNSKNKD